MVSASLKIVTTTETSGVPDDGSISSCVVSCSIAGACATRAVCLLSARNATVAGLSGSRSR